MSSSLEISLAGKRPRGASWAAGVRALANRGTSSQESRSSKASASTVRAASTFIVSVARRWRRISISGGPKCQGHFPVDVRHDIASRGPFAHSPKKKRNKRISADNCVGGRPKNRRLLRHARLSMTAPSSLDHVLGACDLGFAASGLACAQLRPLQGGWDRVPASGNLSFSFS